MSEIPVHSRRVESDRKLSERWSFLHCVGALDGKHVVMHACGQGSLFYNYKGSHSIVLMVFAGPSYVIIWCNVGINERVSDGGVWNRTGLYNSLENGEINLPLAEPLPHRTEDCPYVIVGEPFLMKPYPQQDLDIERQVCNYRFSRARRIVENVFGLLANQCKFFEFHFHFNQAKWKLSPWPLSSFTTG